MSLPHALLTSLLEKPSSGSELTRRFEKSIGYFWQATHQQIYRELGRLEQSGWVESHAEEGARGRKRSYRVLPAGKEELWRWVSEQSDPRPFKDEIMLRVRAEAVVGPSSLIEDLQRRLHIHQQRLAVYKAIEAKDFLGKEPTRESRLKHIILRAGVLVESMYIQFSTEALNILQEDEEPLSK
jgi:DNA-binding PadR family transcriptional regulator